MPERTPPDDLTPTPAKRAKRIRQARPLGERTMRFALFLVRLLPPSLGYFLAERLGRLFGRLAPRARDILESNLAPVVEDRRRRRRVAIEIFAHAARAYYEVFLMPSLPRGKIAAMFNYEEPGYTQFLEAYQKGKGVIMAATHQSSFDAAGQSLAARGYPPFVLALPDPDEGFAFINRMRLFLGARVMPVGPRALREALRVLRSGGIVVTGSDRPVKGQGMVVEMFNRPTLLPDGPIRLALHTGATLLATFCWREKGEYWLRFIPLELTRTGDDEADVRENLQRLAHLMEVHIRAHPEQWHLFQRLWDEE